ncbi:substrate-binding periplasmic protein [Marinobacter sp. 1Y8]
MTHKRCSYYLSSGIKILQLFTLAMLAGGALAGNPPDPVKITNGNWPPYLVDKPPYGVISQIISTAFEAEGLSAEFGFFPWPRSFALAQKGNWDGSAAWSCNPKRLKDFYFSMPVFPATIVLFHRTNKPVDWDTLEDLGKYRIGTSQGYFYGNPFMEAVKSGKLKAETATSDIINFRKLLAGRIDAFPVDVVVGNEILRTAFTAKERRRLTFDVKEIFVGDLHLMLSRQVPGNAALLKRFNRGLEAIRRSGEMAHIIRTSLGFVPPQSSTPELAYTDASCREAILNGT